MNHPNDDTLLKSVLDLLEAGEAREIAEHVSQCPACRTRLEVIQRDTLLLGDIHAASDIPPLPKPRVQNGLISTLLKAAALLLIGFLTGFGASRYACPQPVNVVPSYLNVSTPADTITQYGVCDAIDIAAGVN